MVESVADYMVTVYMKNGKVVKTVHGPACFDVTGYTPEEFLADPYLWINMVVAEDRPLVREYAEQMLRGESPKTIEHRILRKDGTVRWIEHTHTLHPAVKGEYLSYDSLIRDVTRRRQAEEDLKFANVLLSAEHEASIDGILVVGVNGNILSFNRRFAEMWQIPSDVLKSRSDERALQSVLDRLVDPQEFIRKVKYLYEARSEISRDEIALKNGVTFDRYSGPLLGQDNRYYGRIWYFRDMTEHKLELSRMVMQDKMASVGQLAAGVAHEINNPLNFVLLNFGTLKHDIDAFRAMVAAYRDLLSRIPLVKDMAGEIEKIRKQEQDVRLDLILGHIDELFSETHEGIQRVLDIVCSMRDFSRMDDPTRFVRFDINAGVRNTLVITRNICKYCAEVITNFGNVPEIVCVPDLVNRALLNLVVNAAQAIEEKAGDGVRGRITITTHADSDNVYCEIADTGPGIPGEIQARIFDPFFTTKDPGKGLGLGLSISRDIIVNTHGGALEVDSKVGEGSRFLIRLPVVRAGHALGSA